MKTSTVALLYLTFPLLIFWWGWFEWWVALPCSLALGGAFWHIHTNGGKTSFVKPIINWQPFAQMGAGKATILPFFICFGLALIWTYLGGVGGFRPQHFDYFKHNLIINNLVRYDWPVRYADGTYLCYYHAYYLPPVLLAKCVGGMGFLSYYLFAWTWLGLGLLFQLLHRLGGWKLVVFFLFFNSPEAILLIYEAFKSPHTIAYTLADLWTNDHTIELIQTPGGLMFPSHVESFTAAPQHALPAWLTTTLFLKYRKCQMQSAECQVQNVERKSKGMVTLFIVYCVLFIVLLYWSPLVAIGFLPLVVFDYFNKSTFYSLPTTYYPLLVLISLPALIFYAGHVPLHDVRGWWWTFLKTPHQYALLITFLFIEIVVWGILMWFLKKKSPIQTKDFQLIGWALGLLLAFALYRYGYFNDLARRASLPATLVVCWGIAKYLYFETLTQRYHKIIIGTLLIMCALLPIKHHLRWFTKQPYTAIVDKKINDFTPYPIHYLGHYHWGEFDVVAQYLGKTDAAYLQYFAPKVPQKPREISRAFYYWKSVFKLTDYEKTALQKYQATRLYIKFFDVDWDIATHQAIPKAAIQFKENPPVEFVPTVFITNRTLEKLSWGGIDELAEKIVEKINLLQPTKTSHNELQFDCDWTLQTRTKYFRLLNKIRKQLPEITRLSATIRLHQIKFYRTTGIPPVERGMLMYYNMDDWKNVRTHNSILDLTVAGRYANYISDYPLPLDVVLPIFSWTIVYRNGKPLKFINNLTHKDFQKLNIFQKAPQTNQYIARRDTSLFGFSVRRGDRFRVEESTVENLKITTQTLSQEIQNTKVIFALYHLDSLNLSYYEKDSLQQIIQAFR